MNLLLWLVIFVVACLYIIPKICVWILRIYLRKFSFSASIGGFLTFNDVLLCLPIKMNCRLLVRIEQFQIRISAPSDPTNQGWIRFVTTGLQINILLRDDFEGWSSSKIELLNMIDNQRQRMSRLGLLQGSDIIGIFADEIHQDINNKEGKEQGASQQVRQEVQGGLAQMVRDWAKQLKITCLNSQIQFFCYSPEGFNEHHKLIDETNMALFCQLYLDSQDFNTKYNCQRLVIPEAQIGMDQEGENTCDISINGPLVKFQCPIFPSKGGQLAGISFMIKVPLESKLQKQFANYELDVKVKQGRLNLSKAYLKRTIKFFVHLDMLLSVIKAVRRLIFKQHYQDMLVVERVRRSAAQQTRQFFNYRDTVIPKRLRIRIEEDLLFFIEFPSKRLLPFLASTFQTQTVGISLAPNAIFEMARTLKNSYYIQFSNKLFQLETNGLPCLTLHDFKQEIDFTFMKEVTELPIKLSKLEVVNHISGSALKGNLSPALIKVFCEFYNYYKFGIQTSKFKYKILSQLKDKQFLLDNIIASSSNPNFAHIKLTATQVLDIYKVLRHVDTICNRFSVEKIDLRHSSNKIYGLSNPESSLKIPNSHAADLRLYCQGFMAELTKKKGTEDLVVKSTKIAFLQEQILTEAQRTANELPKATNKDQFSIFQARDFEYQKFIKLLYADSEPELHPKGSGPRKNRKIVNKRTYFSKVQANFDAELILDRTRDWLDYSFILKHFNRKWTYKYFRSAQLANQELNWLTDLQNNSLYAQAAEIIWCLSRTRVAIILFDELRPVNFPKNCFQKVKGSKLSEDIEQGLLEFAKSNDSLSDCDQKSFKFQFVSSKASVIHRKQEMDPHLYGIDDQKILDGDNVIIVYESSTSNIGITFKTNTWNMFMPNEFAFGGAFESLFIQKNHVVQYLKREYQAYKRKLDFKFFSQDQEPKEVKQVLDRAFKAELITNKFQLKFAEDEMLQTFVNQNEISELLAARDIFCLKPKSLLNMLKQLKKQGVYDTYLDFQIIDFNARYERPSCYKDQKQAFAKVQTLDEGFKTVSPHFFQLIKGAVHTYSMGYASLNARSLHKPIFEWWNFECKMEMLTGILNSQINKDLFSTPIVQKIFNRFDLNTVYNRLLNKLYYKVDMNMSKIKLCLQGQQTKLVSNDLSQAMSRLTIFQDVSRAIDRRAQKLPYFDGIDQSRHKNHGEFKLRLDKAEIEVWPCRDFNRYSEHLLISLLNLEYSKRLLKKKNSNSAENQHDLCLRAFSMQKLPLKQFETSLVTLPLLEVQISTNYNKGRNCDHYEHLKAQNLDHYLNLLRSYSTKEYDLSLKVNIPSYGPYNDTKGKNLYLPLLMHNYVLYSPVPLIHYQRSHMKFIDEILREYVKGGKIDQSKLVRNKFARTARQRDNQQFLGEMFQQNSADKLYLKVQAFMSDGYLLFTDFDGESTLFDQVPIETLERQTLDPDEIDDDRKRDEYLTRYQGIILSTENLNFQTQVVMDLDKEMTQFEANRSFFKNRFLRLSSLNSKNLFEIRNKKLDHSRLLEWPDSMDNFQYFCQFFGVQKSEDNDQEPDSDIELMLQGFKTIFPQYILKNEQIQHAIDKANWRYETINSPTRDEMKKTSSIFQTQSNFQDNSLNAFSFKETDTIALVERMEYSQDQFISMDNGKTKTRHMNEELKIQPEFQSDEQQLVRHLIDVKNIRFLYTQKIHELITHHIIKGMKFSRFRKTGYIDMEKQRSNLKRDFKAEYKQAQIDLQKSNSASPVEMKSQVGQESQIALVDLRNLEKVTYLALRLTNPQINLQNGLTKSQMLITSGHKSVKVVVYAYSTPTTARADSKRMFQVSVNRRRGTVKTNIVKYELRTQVDQMDLFVAPTYINLEDPTFWVTPLQKLSKEESSSAIRMLNTEESEQFQTPKSQFERQRTHEEGSDYEEQKREHKSEKSQEENDNVLRKILSLKEALLRFEMLQNSYTDHLNPKLTIDFQLQKVACEMDGPSMWHFMSVFKHTLLARGEKSADLIHIENAKLNDLTNLKESALRDLIDKEINRNMYRLGLDVQRPKFARKVQYFIEACEFSFYNQNTKFAEGRIDKAKGLHSIFANKESKSDIDVQRVSMLNLIDADEYRLVVFPHKSTISQPSQHGAATPDHLAIPETMFKLRTRDKYVVVAEAPWRVYDQFEIFIYPTSIQLTRNFYRHFKRFFFENNPFADAETPVHQQKKYDLMIPAKAFQKHLPQQMQKLKDSISIGSGSHHSGGSKRPPIDVEVKSMKPAKDPEEKQQARDFQTFFRYLRMNEVAVSLSYHHGPNSGLNVKKLRIKMKPFLQYGKFQTFRKTVEQYESHCKENLLKQTPNIITQLVVKTKEKIEHLNHLGEEDEETKKQMRLVASKRLLFGDFSGT